MIERWITLVLALVLMAALGCEPAPHVPSDFQIGDTVQFKLPGSDGSHQKFIVSRLYHNGWCEVTYYNENWKEFATESLKEAVLEKVPDE